MSSDNQVELNQVKTLTAYTDEDLSNYINNVERPLVLKGLVDEWPIISETKQSNAKLKEYLLKWSRSIQVGIGKIPWTEKGRLFYNSDLSGFNFERSSCDFSGFISALFSQEEHKKPYGYYMGSTHIDHLMPEFKQSHNIKALSNKNALSSIWISNQTSIAAHQDFPNNLACCIAGKRRFTLFPPEQIDNLYIGPLDHTPAGQPISLVDLNNPDFVKYPKFEYALENAFVAELEPGDALLLPSLWWHAVDSLTSCNVLINYWWQNTANYTDSPYDALYHALLSINNLSTDQQQAVKSMFDYYIFNGDSKALTHIPEDKLGILEKDSELAARKIRSLLLNKLNR